MKVVLALALASFALFAQTPKAVSFVSVPVVPAGTNVDITYSLQPLETFRATYGDKLPGVALYACIICNHNGNSITVEGGDVLSASSLNWVDVGLVPATTTRAQEHSMKYRLATLSRFTALGLGLALNSGFIGRGNSMEIAIGTGLSVGSTAIGTLQSNANSQLQAQTNSMMAANALMLDGEKVVVIPPNACVKRYLLAAYIKLQHPITTTIYGK